MAASPSEKPVNIYQSTRCRDAEYLNTQDYFEILKKAR
jgi:hypothetical protein